MFWIIDRVCSESTRDNESRQGSSDQFELGRASPYKDNLGVVIVLGLGPRLHLDRRYSQILDYDHIRVIQGTYCERTKEHGETKEHENPEKSSERGGKGGF